MTRTSRMIRLLGACLVLALLGGIVASRFAVTADITHFLPDSDDQEIAALSRQITNSELSRTLILAIETPDLATSIAASLHFEAAIMANPGLIEALDFLEGGPAKDIDRALFDLYEPRRLAFLAATPETAQARLTDEGLQAAARSLKDELAGPLSALATRVAPRDPFLTIPALFRRLETARSSELAIEKGRFVTRDGTSAILFLGTQASALDAKAQAPILAALRSAFREVEAITEVPIRLDLSGVHPMATRTAETIEGDIKRVSTISSLLLAGLLLLLFRSLRFVFLAAVPVLYGVLAGAAFVLMHFGRLHGITLAFGAALIGVSIDYVVHLYCHRTIVAPAGGPEASLRAIFRPLATGAITTIAGFLALAASDLSGLREIALFSVVGLTAAFLASVVLAPLLMSDRQIEVPLRERWVSAIEQTFPRLGQHRNWLALLPAAALLVAAAGLPGVHFNSDLSSMGQLDPDLLAEDERVRAKVMRFEQTRFVVALGEDEEAALIANDATARQLEAAIAAGELGAQRSLAPLLPSRASQGSIAAVARNDASLPDRLRKVFEAEGFAAGAFEPFLTSLTEPLPEALDFEALMASPAASFVRPFRVQLGDRVGLLTFLSDVHHPAAIEQRLASLQNVHFLQQSDLWAAAQLQYQHSTAKLLLGGLLVVLILLAIRYRDGRRTLIAFLPSVLAAAVTVSILSLAGRGLDLISLTALLFVVSMGVDYSVFLVDANDEAQTRSVAAALTGALLAGTSTVIAFGLLALSDHPVLSGLGLTASVGIGMSLLLAPTVLLLLRPENHDSEKDTTS